MNSHQNLDLSFNSSQSLSLSDSTHSIASRHVTRKHVSPDKDQFLLVKSPKSENQSEKFVFNENKDFFIGFKNGWGKNEIKVNESKLKKARKFFQDSQDYNEQNTNTFSVFNQGYNLQSQKGQLQFSMPCFKTVGKGTEIKISSQAKLRVKSIFEGFQSIKKPTKLKKQSKLITESMVKTVGAEQKLQKLKQNKFGNKRVSFNFEEYQKQYKLQIEREMALNSKSKSKRKTLKIGQSKGSNKANSKEYIYVKLFQLTITPERESMASKQLAIDASTINTKIFTHYHEHCSIMQCLLCKIKFTNESFGIKDIYELLNSTFSHQHVPYPLFQQLYDQVTFKLMKYTTHWPEIINKNIHPTNILKEIHKKIIQLQREPSSSYLQLVMSADKIGKKVNVIVRDKYVNNKMQIIFIKLSDGWSSVWAAIETKNMLYEYLEDDKRIHVGSKLSICLWNLHPISNILDFNSKGKQERSKQCIQFYYNGSIILQPNSKLGYTSQIFYRPLNRCRMRGGYIPVVQGTILRFFSINQKIKNPKAEYSSYVNFVQILTPQGFTCLIKFILHEEESLVEYFRLYHTYFFYKLKINQEKYLFYHKECSKFQEIKVYKIVEKDMIYPEMVEVVLVNRLLNKKEDLQGGKDVEGQLWDVVNNKGKVQMSDGKEYKIQVDGMKNIHQYALLQQYSLIGLINETLCFEKHKHSSQSRRLPGIYTKLLLK